MAEDEEVIDEEAEVEERNAESDAGLTPAAAEKPLAPPKYEVRPALGDKFQAENVKEIIKVTMREQLIGRQYRGDQVERWANVIATAVRQRVQALDMKRYKILVQTTILEMKGAGFKCGQRCIWDPETDYYTDDIFKNDTIYCHTIVYGVYMY